MILNFSIYRITEITSSKVTHPFIGGEIDYGEYEGSVGDYVDLQRLMFTLNAHYKDGSFRIFGKSKVAFAFRENIRNGFEGMVNQYKEDKVTIKNGE